MFVELDMSLRAITHKLTEDRILTPTYAKQFQEQPPEDAEVKLEHCLWRYSTIRKLLTDVENIGTLVVCKHKQTLGQDGRHRSEPHPSRKELPGGIPAIINPVIYERAQAKLKTNQADKSHLPLHAEDYLLRGHVFCAACQHAMKPRTRKNGRATRSGQPYPIYACAHTHNNYDACPSLPTIRTSPLDDIVWQECCGLFERIEVLQTALELELQAAIHAMLEDTTGQQQIQNIEATIQLAKTEREKYEEGSYMHNLLSQDITRQETELARYTEEISAAKIDQVARAYRQQLIDFWDFLNVMRGSYDQATFQEKRNALDMLGVRVLVHEPTETYGLSSAASGTDDTQEWFTTKEAGHCLGVHAVTILRYLKNGIITQYKEGPDLLVHRDDVLRLQVRGFRQFNTAEMVRGRIEISYSPRFTLRLRNPTGVQVSTRA